MVGPEEFGNSFTCKFLDDIDRFVQLYSSPWRIEKMGYVSQRSFARNIEGEQQHRECLCPEDRLWFSCQLSAILATPVCGSAADTPWTVGVSSSAVCRK